MFETGAARERAMTPWRRAWMRVAAPESEYYETGGEILWMPTNGTELTPLGQQGKSLRWGPMP